MMPEVPPPSPPATATASGAATGTGATMRAVQGKDYGPIDEMLSVDDNVPLPSWLLVDDDGGDGEAEGDDKKRLKKLQKQRKNKMIIKVLSVALAPGDCRVLSGLTRELQGPPSFPYIPGGDCSGTVVRLPPDAVNLPFKVGDRVACRFDGKPMGALAEYAVVSTRIAAKIPPATGVSGVDAAALASASPAIVLAERTVLKDQRVLVLGARGGVGAHLCQLLKPVYGASYVAAVSSRPNDILRLPSTTSSNTSTSATTPTSSPLVDDAIDYNTQDVFTMPKYQSQKFDLVVDLAGFGYERFEAMVAQDRRQPLIVKTASEGGRALTLVPPVGPIFEIRSVWGLFKTFVFPLLWKAFASRTFKRKVLPKYTFGQGLPENPSGVVKALEWANKGQLKAIVDPKGPFPFTTQGVRDAFRNLESRHSLGKTVIQVRSDDD